MAAETLPSGVQMEYSAFVQCFPASGGHPMFTSSVSAERQHTKPEFKLKSLQIRAQTAKK
jgi:hypothetical protein